MGWCLLREGADASAFELLLEATHREDADGGARDVVDLVGRCVLVTASDGDGAGSFPLPCERRPQGSVGLDRPEVY